MLYQSGKIRRQVQKRVRPQVDKIEELKDEEKRVKFGKAEGVLWTQKE